MGCQVLLYNDLTLPPSTLIFPHHLTFSPAHSVLNRYLPDLPSYCLVISLACYCLLVVVYSHYWVPSSSCSLAVTPSHFHPHLLAAGSMLTLPARYSGKLFAAVSPRVFPSFGSKSPLAILLMVSQTLFLAFLRTFPWDKFWPGDEHHNAPGAQRSSFRDAFLAQRKQCSIKRTMKYVCLPWSFMASITRIREVPPTSGNGAIIKIFLVCHSLHNRALSLRRSFACQGPQRSFEKVEIRRWGHDLFHCVLLWASYRERGN